MKKENKKVMIVGDKEVAMALKRSFTYLYGYDAIIEDISLDIKLKGYDLLVIANTPFINDTKKRYTLYALPYLAAKEGLITLVGGGNDDPVFRDGWSDIGSVTILGFLFEITSFSVINAKVNFNKKLNHNTNMLVRTLIGDINHDFYNQIQKDKRIREVKYEDIEKYKDKVQWRIDILNCLAETLEVSKEIDDYVKKLEEVFNCNNGDCSKKLESWGNNSIIRIEKVDS